MVAQCSKRIKKLLLNQFEDDVIVCTTKSCILEYFIFDELFMHCTVSHFPFYTSSCLFDLPSGIHSSQDADTEFSEDALHLNPRLPLSSILIEPPSHSDRLIRPYVRPFPLLPHLAYDVWKLNCCFKPSEIYILSNFQFRHQKVRFQSEQCSRLSLI